MLRFRLPLLLRFQTKLPVAEVPVAPAQTTNPKKKIVSAAAPAAAPASAPAAAPAAAAADDSEEAKLSEQAQKYFNAATLKNEANRLARVAAKEQRKSAAAAAESAAELAAAVEVEVEVVRRLLL